MPLRFTIDHAVIAVRDLDRAASAFRELGFTLTPRGQHGIGSQNHCIMFRTTYIELLAAPTPHPWLDYYREFLRSGDGLAAIALRVEDAAAAYEAFCARGIPAKAPMDLARPVEGGLARFRLVQIADLPYVFAVEHCTPELVWRAHWQRHDNGAAELVEAALAVGQPFEGLPAAIEWSAPPQLGIRGLRSDLLANGVRLRAA